MNSAVAAPKLCTTCGARYAADALFCPADGTPLTSAASAQLGQRGSDPGGDSYLGREISGHIEIRQLAGVGAMGRVYRAFQKGIDRDVAVKVLHRELSANAQLVQRFHREAKVASRLQHPNVVQVHLAGQLPDGALYIVMEYLDGLSLQSALAAAGGAMPLPRALHVGLQICDAVGEAHAQGIVHRDLKPENVMLVNRGEDPDYVKVLDFGIARLNWGDQSMATAAGLIFGTARYISPEGAQGEIVSPMGDVYSIATLLYQMLAGRTPFEGEQAVALLIQQIHDPPPPLRSIPRGAYVPAPIADVVMKNLSKDALGRLPDARALGRALLEAAKASGLSAEDLVPRSVLLGARGAMQLPAIQRTKQLQLEKGLADLIQGAAARGSSPSTERIVTNEHAARASSNPGVAPTTAPMAPVNPQVSASPQPGPVTAAMRPTPAPSMATGLATPTPPEAMLDGRTQKWVPPADFHAQVGRPPSNVDITLDDASGPMAPVFPEPSRPGPSRPSGTEYGEGAHGPNSPHVPSGSPQSPQAPQSPRVDALAAGTVAASGEAPSKPSSSGERNVDSTISGEARGVPKPGRLRWVGVVLFCFLLGIGATTFGAYKMNFIGPDSSHGTLDDQVARASDALHHKRWDAPAGDNVRDLTTEGLTRWPNEARIVDIRERASDELVKEAVGRKFAGDIQGALHLARLAHELDPSDTTAAHLVEQYETESNAQQGAIVVLPPPAIDASAPLPILKTPVTATGPFRTAMDISPSKPRVGQAVDLVVKVTTSSGGAPKRGFDEPRFQISGAAMGSTGVATLPASADGNGVFRASFTFLSPGKYDIAFNARADGLVIKTSRVLLAEEARVSPSAPPETPPPAPSASVKWL